MEYYFYFMISILILLSKEKENIISRYSYITLKINESGNQKVFNYGEHPLCHPESPYPDEIYINGINQSEIKMYYPLTETNNNIKLVWYNNIIITRCMFLYCRNITEINLMNFDSSQVKDMAGMFNSCSSLKYINFTNFNTSQVESMDYMFFCCDSLNSLNLSIFDTSQVQNMQMMFFNCKSLYSLDISNFNFEKVTNIQSIFNLCSSLKHINIENIIFNNNFLIELRSLSKEIIICSEKEEIQKLEGLCEFINCINNKKNNNLKCFKYCDNFEINNEIICDKCGNNYHKIFNDSNNNNSYFYCYNSPEGYYLEESFYKLCHSTCKTCDKNGNEEYHNCIECKDHYKYRMNISNYHNCNNTCSNYHYVDKYSNKLYCTLDLNCPFNYNKLISNKSECIEDCKYDPIFYYEYKGICYDKNIDDRYNISLNQSEFENIIQNILNYHKYRQSEILNGKDIEFKIKDIINHFCLLLLIFL